MAVFYLCTTALPIIYIHNICILYIMCSSCKRGARSLKLFWCSPQIQSPCGRAKKIVFAVWSFFWKKKKMFGHDVLLLLTTEADRLFYYILLAVDDLLCVCDVRGKFLGVCLYVPYIFRKCTDCVRGNSLNEQNNARGYFVCIL